MHLQRRAELHAALGDPARLAIVDELAVSDRSPGELSASIGLRPSLLAFHLDTLERVGIVRRSSSSGDRRRKYVQLVPGALDELARPAAAPTAPVLFVCTHNSARSQLAAALWRRDVGRPASSAGTHPADRVHPLAVDAARRAGLSLDGARPTRLEQLPADHHVVTVCDQAHEELDVATTWHWSIPDPVADGSTAAFDTAVRLLTARIHSLVPPEAP